jgi:hypothetical protein
MQPEKPPASGKARLRETSGAEAMIPVTDTREELEHEGRFWRYVGTDHGVALYVPQETGESDAAPQEPQRVKSKSASQEGAQATQTEG